MLIIGNEILSGRTQDKNLNYIANGLAQKGIRLLEARVVADIEDDIVDALNVLRARYTYVFTSGGIGPTHDDITAASVAKAFGQELIQHPQAVEQLTEHYGKDQLTDARLRMANTPKEATLIPNKISSAPGFCVENVYVMAGVPKIMQVMFEALVPSLQEGAIVHSVEISVRKPESKIAEPLAEIQERFPDADIGSYPFSDENGYGTNLVVRSEDKALLDEVATQIKSRIGDWVF